MIDPDFFDKLIVLGIPYEPGATVTTFKIYSSTPAQPFVLDPKNKCIFQICTQEARLSKVSAPKVDAFKVGTHKIRAFKVSTSKIGAFKVSTKEIGSF
jgi:hypothetical protein